MRYHSTKQIASLCLLGALMAWPSIGRAATPYTVAPGWDLFPTVSALFQNVAFQGVPLGTYNFGGAIGVQNVGNTDTIIYRPAVIVGSSGGTVGFAGTMVAWQLRSVNQVSFGGGPLGYYYLTLQSARGGPASIDTGSMYFNPDNTQGTFSDLLDVFFDVRYGSLNGPIVYSADCLMQNDGAGWTHAGSYPPVIDEVNHYLYGPGDIGADFWSPYVIHFDPQGDIHIVPEPSGLVLFGVGALALFARVRSNRE
jgi:hypothetical protein